MTSPLPLDPLDPGLEPEPGLLLEPEPDAALPPTFVEEPLPVPVFDPEPDPVCPAPDEGGSP